MKLPPAFTSLACTIGLLGAASGEAVKDREGAVRSDKAKHEASARWNYNDVEAGFRRAAETGKPLLIVLRCIPCLACMGIDASVLDEGELGPLLDQFICVRVIDANSLDLARFQFDYDLSFSALLFNGDGTVYGRYGSWLHQKEPLNKTTEGFRKTLEAGLAVHRGYPANKAALAGKQGKLVPFQRPTEFPSLGKYGSKLDWDGKVVQSCVHCHMVGDAFRAFARKETGTLPVEAIYPQPSPEILGISLAAEEVATVRAVNVGSSAASAGIQAGDRFISVGGAPLISMADFSWMLHCAPDAGTLPAVIDRAGKEMPIALDLPAGWRSRSDIERRVGTWQMRAMAFGGMKLEAVDDAARESLGLGKDAMALRIAHVGQYGEHAAAKRAGFQKDDVLVSVGDLRGAVTESALLGHLLQHHRPGEKLSAEVLRGKERVTLQLPQQ